MNRTLYTFLFCVVLAQPLAAQDISRATKALDAMRSEAKGLDLAPLETRTPALQTRPELRKLDPGARQIVMASRMNKQGAERMLAEIDDYISVHRSTNGRTYIDLFIEVTDGGVAALQAAGVEVRTQVGDIVVARAPVESLEEIAHLDDVRRVEASVKRNTYMAAARAATGVDLVHTGTGLPRAYRGEGVVVGVLDSGIDFTHPDFSTNAGTRIRYLLEYTNDGGQKEWTKAQIDANPAAVTQRDGNGGGGHGTHVAGIAAGGGRSNPTMTGVAPGADIIFVKGIRDPDSNGGFGDTDVVGGTQYIFDRAGEMGKPAVVNLSLGGNWGPLDGTTLYEQALSELTGPGRIIVAAAGNEGIMNLHAGGISQAGLPNQTIALPYGPDNVQIGMWYEQGVIEEVSIAILDVVDGMLTPVAHSGWVPVGATLEPLALEVNGAVAGSVYIDAETTTDPNNGDGNVIFIIGSNGVPDVDISESIWAIYSRGSATGRADLWIGGGEFQPTMLGFTGVNEMPGNTDFTVGAPATAEKVISVGSYVTTNTWTNIDGNRYEWQNPDLQNPGRQVVPVIGQKSYFSSHGPTRDGRTVPDISAPGEFIFSTLSSHLTEGTGYDRSDVLQGGGYVGQQGTSMASPHLAGVVALMLQANPNLDVDDVREILANTARADQHTGAVPNNRVGAGKVDALNAVLTAAGAAGGGGENPGAEVQMNLRNFDDATEPLVFAIDRVYPIDSGFVAGTNIYLDRAKASAFRLPAGTTSGKLDDVSVWFTYRAPGSDGRRYAVEVYAGDGATGPVGAPLARKEFSFSGVAVDSDLQTPEDATIHTFDTPVAVGSTFFVSVDFGAYDISRAGDLAIGTTNFTGGRVAEVWDRLSNGGWANTSDAWSFGGAGGADGLQLWMEAGVRVATSTSSAEADEVPTSVVLEQNYPNPFNPRTTIAFAMPHSGRVHLAVYDLLGRRVATLVDGVLAAGAHIAAFDATNVASGLYLYRLETANGTATRTMTVLK